MRSVGCAWRKFLGWFFVFRLFVRVVNVTVFFVPHVVDKPRR